MSCFEKKGRSCNSKTIRLNVYYAPLEKASIEIGNLLINQASSTHLDTKPEPTLQPYPGTYTNQPQFAP